MRALAIHDPHMSPQDKRLAIEQLQKGIIQHRAEQLGLAQSHYQRAAKLDPHNPSAWHLLGVCALQMNNLALAAKHLRTCIKVSPGFAEAHNNLGVALRRMGRHADSVAAFHGALKARERYVEAAYNLGLAHESTAAPAEAERAYRLALLWRANYVDASMNLANLLRRQGRFDEALPLQQIAQQTAPDNPATNGNLALLLSDMGRNAEAVRYAHAAATLDPGNVLWWKALGVAERMRKNYEPAIAALRNACELSPKDDSARSELALAYGEVGDVEQARALMARADPREIHYERMRWSLALSLPSVYRDEAQVEAERERFAHGLDEIKARLHFDSPAQREAVYYAVIGVAPFLLHYQPRDNTALQCRFGDLVTHAMQRIAPVFMQPCDWQPRAHGGRVRVGIVSSHLMRHTVSNYFQSLLRCLDAQRFDVHVWYSGQIRDDSTAELAASVAAFEYVGDDALTSARRIRDSQLDVLIYPEIGMDPRHQALASMRLAPVQCVLYGHPATCGLANVDYFISGEALEPANAETHYRERLVCLPGIGAQPRRPPAPGNGDWYEREVQAGPLLLCLQNHLKLEPGFDAVLARVAIATQSRIGFFSRNPSLVRRFRERIEGTFVRAGADPSRHLAFLPVQSYPDYLAGIARAPLVLDSPWFSGGATSLDAFSVGTPVLALEGAMARGRQTSGMLRMLGIEELIATSDDDYVEKAAALLRDAQRSLALREKILQRKSVLFDDDAAVVAFANFVESVAPVT